MATPTTTTTTTPRRARRRSLLQRASPSLSLSLFTLVIVASMTASASASAAPPVTPIKSLEHFGELVRAHDELLVMFAAPWCGHCKRLTPEFERAATLSRVRTHFASVDCTADATKQLCDVHGVRGYPTVKLFAAHRRTGVAYDGERAAVAIVSWLGDARTRRVTAPATLYTELDELVSSVVPLDEQRAQLDAQLGRTPWALINFHSRGCVHCEQLAPELATLAERLEQRASSTPLAERVQLVGIECSSFSALCAEFGVRAWPLLSFWSTSSNTRYTGDAAVRDNRFERSADTLLEYYEGRMAALVRTPADEEARRDADLRASTSGGAVRNIESVAELQHVFGEREAVLVKFFAPWCGHCKAMSADFAAAAARVRASRLVDTVAFVEVDCTGESAKLLCHRHGVSSFPTLRWFTDHGHQHRDFPSPQRTADAFVSFVAGQMGLLAELGDDDDDDDDDDSNNNNNNNNGVRAAAESCGATASDDGSACGVDANADPAKSTSGEDWGAAARRRAREHEQLDDATRRELASPVEQLTSLDDVAKWMAANRRAKRTALLFIGLEHTACYDRFLRAVPEFSRASRPIAATFDKQVRETEHIGVDCALYAQRVDGQHDVWYPDSRGAELDERSTRDWANDILWHGRARPYPLTDDERATLRGEQQAAYARAHQQVQLGPDGTPLDPKQLY